MKLIELESETDELQMLFLSFCSFVTLTQGKKLNIPNIFLLTLKNHHLRNIFKARLDLDTDFEAVSIFLRYSPSLYKSKYIMKYLNKTKPLKLS